jgi:Carbohydrate esterase, sialic acid-specific acetylesterase/Carbohydrate binding module (family 35)/Bacterial Ig domain/Secretion system C-terminal sorting domain
MKGMKIRVIALLFLSISGYCLSVVNAQFQTARIFGNGMVLQREMDIPVWGAAGAGDTIIVTLNGSVDTAFADEAGKWEATLPAMSAGGPYTMTIVRGSTALTRTNVYIGDVWLASGQSNMEFKLSQSDGAAAEIAAANNQTIRQFLVQNNLGNEPAEDVPAGSAWTAAVSSSVGNFTAVGYYFAKYLQQDIGIPVGIINASKGGARIETFMSDEMLGYDEQDITLANGEAERQPTVAYNTLIHPLLRVPLKGIIWYQAESNGDNMEDALSYGHLFKKLIVSYRDLWNLGDIPFIWVQLPNQGAAAVESAPNAWDAWPKLREAQTKALVLPNTGEATTIDVGDVDIHPTKKEPVGQRLALVARKVAYGEDLVYSGPRFKGHTLSGDGSVKIGFDHVGGGLIAKNSAGDSIHWFSMAGSDGILHQAEAVITGDSVVVKSQQVPAPTLVRYAWEYNPVNVNFYNAEDLPAVPFMINTVNPAFGIQSFTASSTTIERGKSTVLSWTIYGASSVTLNGEPVDSIDGLRVLPGDTSVYILNAVNRNDAGDTDADTITINVIEPRPTIELTSDAGDMVAPETEITFTAKLTIPEGLTIVKVEFFIDDALLFTDTEAPYEALWTPPSAGEYIVKAVVTDANGAVVESNPIDLVVTNLTVLTFEAENAVRTGSGTVRNNATASGGKYVDMTDAWTLTFSGITVPETKEYQLSIRYLLNYDSPKTQNLKINGTLVKSIEFTAPNTSTWMTYRLDVTLVAGTNEIVIEGVWNWMSFDYIAIAGEGLVGIENIGTDRNSCLVLSQNEPNPFSQSTRIDYSLPESGHVMLEVYNIAGKKVASLVNEDKASGMHSCQFIAEENLPGGIYLARLTFNHNTITKRMVLKH